MFPPSPENNSRDNDEMLIVPEDDLSTDCKKKVLSCFWCFTQESVELCSQCGLVASCDKHWKQHRWDYFPPGEFIFPPGEIILLLVRLFSSWWDFSLQVSSCWSFLLTGKTQDLIDDSINFRDDDWSCFPIRVNQNHHYCQNCFLNLDLIRDDDGTCFPIRVDQHPHFGRRLVATRDIKRGEVRIGWILNHHNHSFSTLSSL